MSFSLPSVKPRVERSVNIRTNDDKFGVPDFMTNGLKTVRSELDAGHPLMESETNYAKHRDLLNMTILQNTQGLHAPLRIAMECRAAKKIGRLPFLQSSNVMFDSLTGRDLEIGPEDVFNLPEFQETLRHPHAMVEKSLGIV